MKFTPKYRTEKRISWVAFPLLGLALYAFASIVGRRLWSRPKIVIVAQSGPGRLGNQLFQYASALGISHAKGVEFCVSVEHPFPFDAIFQGPFPKCTQQLPQIAVVHELGYGIYTDFRLPICFFPPCYVTVGTYLQSFKYLDQDVRHTFQFLPAIQQEAATAIQKIRPHPGSILVGIHVRRGDLEITNYLNQAPVSYFARAMDFFSHKYDKTVKFVVASDDIPWCQDQGVFDSAAMVHSTPAVDLAILSLCNHIIMSVGTFGWFAGKFAGGDVVYYEDAIVLDHLTNAGQILLQDYYPPEWVPMRWHKEITNTVCYE